MLSRFFVLSAALVATAIASAQTISLAQVDTVPTQAADLATFQRNVTHWTFDLRFAGSVTPMVYAARKQTCLNVAGTGRIWHATDENLGDPNSPGFGNNLLPPIPVPATTNTSHFDTFFTWFGAPFVTPSFDSPGGITSTDATIHGNEIDGTDVPLGWFNTAHHAIFSGTTARLTFETPAGLGLSLTQDAGHPDVFATLTGEAYVVGVPVPQQPFSFTIYQAPEPSGAVLLLIGAALISHRRGSESATR